MNVLITQGWPKELVTKYDEYEKRLTDRGFNVYLHPKRTNLGEDELIESLQGVDVFMCGLGKVTRRVLENAPSLRMVAKFGVGLESIDIPACTEFGVPVVNCPGSATDPVAEFTVAMLLSAARGLVENDRMAHAGKWGRTLGISPFHKTLGIIGFGAIGRRVAEAVSGFSMRIIAYTPHPKPEIAAKYGVEMVSMDELIEQSDFITLHLPYTKDTCKMVNADFLSRMKEGAILINAARGALVDEHALYQALKSGHLHAAALDVHEHEPILPDDPLLSLDNCIMTTHNAASSVEGRNYMMEYCVQNVLDVMDGIAPKGLVNPEVFPEGKIGLFIRNTAYI